MEYKPVYSAQEINELLAWIDTRPSGKLDLGSGVYIDDLLAFTQNARHTVATQGSNPIFSGLVYTLMQARRRTESSPTP